MRALYFAFTLIALSVIGVWQVTQIPDSPVYAAVGASLVPTLLTGLLVALSLGYLLSVWRQQAPDAQTETPPLAGKVVRCLYFLAAGAIFILGLKPIGFVLTGTLAGSFIARAFDQPLSWRTVVGCGLIALFFWSVFSLALGVNLGPIFGAWLKMLAGTN